ncbi:tryptophan 7-halogenase [Streptomyces sp. H10-C2]|uniref:tryptophan halogenase family protein n=1 Tax=unclassified Streptomyces TaxID=2593676 RepID=UPI0024BAC2B6|nr:MULTISPECIES: tryptophan halogenase family protein [unclassified Streptomyces]MDJ0346000.1 tryptophan 7-halogenase [Streptomyces sp. PH10-H1]MDJ0370493.1 tryptophan 7-halogenase [Streptomyces sp. H10-C2]
MDHKLLGLGLGPDNGNELDRLLASFPDQDAESVRSWLPGRGGSGTNPMAMLENLAAAGDDFVKPDENDPRAIRRIGVIGGGTAGYFTALALKAKRPWLDVTLMESKQIPIIGVGEATVSYVTLFLHHYLGIDPEELYRRVRPTWKLGIKFDWGPHPDGFMGPFDWSGDAVGMLGSIATTGNINGATLGSAMMEADRAAVYDVGGAPLSLMKYLPFAYHLDNGLLVSFLAELAQRRGIHHVEATLEDVVLSGDDWVERIRTTDGRDLSFDLYVDCTGFRSRLLGQALKTPYNSFGSSLFTDSAVTGNIEHGGHIKPYTQATTMNAGWCWRIPTRDSDHRGYVYSSSAISDDEAAHELATRFPGISDPRVVRFRSGRYEKAWRGNVIGIGNSYAFVEPLESTGLVMIAVEAQTLVATLPASWDAPQVRDTVNAGLAQQWDAIRWLLAIHYRYNTRLNTPFWKECVATADVSGFQPLLDVFAGGAPLTRRNVLVQDLLNRIAPTFFGLFGIDYLLLGQQVPTRLLPMNEPVEKWHARKRAADVLVGRSMPTRQALEAFDAFPELNRQLLEDEDSWAGPAIARRVGLG